ncbi:ARM repeat-containing protein [Athelia psychrophila]|uniref:Importin-13 n=1 Tax=Athelia psychrophila TaxID=1759441 RepID=A0A166VVW5_9AGAM|nr:ARM repeat-containing protein [Fibularhizoctonia sp. CBS 109695]
MATASFLPQLSPYDVERACQLIQQTYTPGQTVDDQRRLQQELLEMQRRPEAWGLVIPFLDHQDPNVQFFGAHTAQVKIARDWDAFPQDHALQLRDLILDMTAHSVLAGHSKVILRKLFVALTSLALKLVPTRPPRWPDWILMCVTLLSGRGVSTEHLLDFLSIVAEEVETSDLLASSKAQMMQSLSDAVPMVVQAITTSISLPRETLSSRQLDSAMKCLVAWMPILPSNDLTPLIPLLISLLAPSHNEFDDAIFIPASDALQEVMSKSAMSDGSGSKTLTEPLLIWLDTWAGPIVETTLSTGFVDSVSHSLCKLIIAIGDHSTTYLASNLATPASPLNSTKTKAQLVQTFLRLILAYTSLPGFYGVDEEESEMTLGFWYLFQEALWSVDYTVEDGDEEPGQGRPLLDEEAEKEKQHEIVAKAVYSELVQTLRRKVTWPPATDLNEWAKDQREKFQVYRRDVGDTLINAFYILREDMLGYYLKELVERLTSRQGFDGWEEIESTLHCVMSIQEAVPVDDSPHLTQLFSSEILGMLPNTGSDRIRRTTLGLIGTYASWFTTQTVETTSATQSSLLMNAINFVVTALPEPSLCLQAANALRDLCDANRSALAPHIGAFAELHAGLTGVPDTEKMKVLQSIASVIQALPPEEEIPPVEAIVIPIINNLAQAIQSSTQVPEDAKALAITQLQTLSGVAKGLTRTADSLFFDESPTEQLETGQMERARADPRMAKLREGIFSGIGATLDLWSTDAAVSDAVSDLTKSITALPLDITLITLPAGPLLEQVCLAAQRQLTAVWLTLAGMLIVQLAKPTLDLSTLKLVRNSDAQNILSNVLPSLLQTSLTVLSQPGAMEANPDIVQAFFSCMDNLARDFVEALFRIDSGLFTGLIQCAIGSLALQERYSLVSACTFLGSLINKTFASEDLDNARGPFIEAHGRPMMKAILCGFAGTAPRSVVPNLIELLSTLLLRCPADSRVWMENILFADDFVSSRADADAKNKFIKSLAGARTIKRTRDAAQQFTLIARGLEGSNFGYASAVA